MKSILSFLWVKGLFSLVFAVLLNAGSCNPIPPFPGGIRMIAYEAAADDPQDTLPVQEVGDSGSLLSVVGQGHGNQEVFSGFTGANGVDDHPNAEDNSNWQVLFNYAVSFSGPPGCGQATQTGFVPLGGAEFDETCLV